MRKRSKGKGYGSKQKENINLAAEEEKLKYSFLVGWRTTYVRLARLSPGINSAVTCTATHRNKGFLKQNIGWSTRWAQGTGCILDAEWCLFKRKLTFVRRCGKYAIIFYFLHNLGDIRHILMRFWNTKLINIDRESSFSSLERLHFAIIQLHSCELYCNLFFCLLHRRSRSELQFNLCSQSALFCHLYF